MPALVTVDDVSKVFPLEDGGSYVALKDIDLEIDEGEFVSLIGHSGCGKSTLLNLLAGLNEASSGGILMDGRQITEPGPDRMVVFQNYSLLPWQTVRENVNLAVANVLRSLPAAERIKLVDEKLKMVGLSAAADKYPKELSGGMKQRVAIARALAIQPRLLLLDEPFGALDALTRGNLQQQLMQICQQAGVTTVMVTHDVDEALLLSDRVVMLTNGPEAGIGQILPVPLARPRERLAVMEHPDYYQLRSELIGFLQQQRRLKQRSAELARTQVSANQASGNQASANGSKAPASGAAKARGAAKATGTARSTGAPGPGLVRLGFMPGIDIAPLALAIEHGLYDQEQLKILPVPFSNWEVLEQHLIEGKLEAAITAATTPLALTMGLSHHPSPWAAITPLTVSRNGNALCLSRRLLDLGLKDPASLRNWLDGRERPLTLAVPQRRGIAELLLRHWFCQGGIDLERQLDFVALSPTLMVGALRTEAIDGFCAGRYRVAEAVEDRLGWVMATDLEIWSGHPEKVLTCAESWAARQPDSLAALGAALIRAGALCDDSDQRGTLTQVLSQPQWLGTRAAIALQRQFDLGTGSTPTQLLRFNQFHANRCHLPNPAEGAWILSQFSRWGWSPFPSNRVELLTQVYRADLYAQAMELAGYANLRPSRQAFTLADGIPFHQDDPLAYLKALPDQVVPALASVRLPAVTDHISTPAP
jgi:nitrate/nitrite transport system ATP-binding protein